MDTLSSPVSPLADPALLGGRLMQRANNREGLPEIVSGLFMLLISGLVYAGATATLGLRTILIALALLTLTSSLAGRPLLNWIRRRYLIERSGYVQFKPMERRYLALCVLIVVGVVLTFLAVRLLLPARCLLALGGLVWGSIQALLGRTIGLPRFTYVGAIIAVAGAVLSFSAVPLLLGFSILFGVYAVASLISGGAAFVRFLRQQPARDVPDER